MLLFPYIIHESYKLVMLSTFGNIHFVTTTVDVVLTSAWACLDSLPSTIVVRLARVVSCTTASGSRIGIVVTGRRVVVVIGGITLGACITIYIRPIAASISADICATTIHTIAVGGSVTTTAIAITVRLAERGC